MKRYIVGGYVRDKLLGKSPQDRDWVVVGATEAEMVSGLVKRYSGVTEPKKNCSRSK